MKGWSMFRFNLRQGVPFHSPDPSWTPEDKREMLDDLAKLLGWLGTGIVHYVKSLVVFPFFWYIVAIISLFILIPVVARGVWLAQTRRKLRSDLATARRPSLAQINQLENDWPRSWPERCRLLVANSSCEISLEDGAVPCWRRDFSSHFGSSVVWSFSTSRFQ